MSTISRHHRQRAWRGAGGVILLALYLFLALAPAAEAVHRRTHQFPRTANLFLKWHLSTAETEELAHYWDVIILDMEVAENSPKELARLRELNPKAKLLAYVTAQEARRDLATNPQAPLRRALATYLRDAWYLKSPAGNRVAWWPQTWLLNITERASVVDGLRWTDALAAFVADRIATNPIWDGVYYDNLWGGISWFTNDAIDLDGDGREEDAATRDRLWTAGTRALLDATRAATPPGFLVTGNGGVQYAPDTNGLLLEHFPNTNEGAWSQSMAAYRTILARAAAPALAILNSNTANTGNRADYRRMRFGLASALLDNGYYSFDFGDQDHAQLWPYDEYDVYLGDPKGAARLVGQPVGASAAASSPAGVYRRDFVHGVALVNATDVEQPLVFDEEFERIHGTQDPATNDGTIVDSVVLPPRDGLVLLRPLATLVGAPFTNGAFARVFRPDGTTVRTGFFAYEGRFRGGTAVAVMDLTRDGAPELVVADRTTVHVYQGERELRRFDPFGPTFTGGIDFAIGDIDGNGTWEIVAAPKSGGGVYGVWNLLEGRLLTPMIAPFGTRYRAGMSVAFVDRDADGKLEIVVGSGAGVAPEVRTYGNNGRLLGRFAPFEATFRGGVHVAGGDLVGDRRGEIVVGAGPGGEPRVRIFPATGGKHLSEFLALSRGRKTGVDVAVADLDGDGRPEVLGLSTQAFTIASE